MSDTPQLPDRLQALFDSAPGDDGGLVEPFGELTLDEIKEHIRTSSQHASRATSGALRALEVHMGDRTREMAVLNTTGLDGVLAMASLGTTPSMICREMHISPLALQAFVHAHGVEGEEALAAAEKLGVAYAMDTAVIGLKHAESESKGDVSRHVALLEHARWMAERVDPEKFGTSAQRSLGSDLGNSVAVTLDIALVPATAALSKATVVTAEKMVDDAGDTVYAPVAVDLPT